MTSGNSILPKPKLTQIYVATWRHWNTISCLRVHLTCPHAGNTPHLDERITPFQRNQLNAYAYVSPIQEFHFILRPMICAHNFVRRLTWWYFQICIYSCDISAISSKVASPSLSVITWWRHQMETFSALLAICAGNSPHKGQWRGALMFFYVPE